MDTNELLQRFKPLIKQNLLSLALALFGLIFFGYGLIVLFSQKSSDDITFETADNQTVLASTSAQKQQEIVVDIEGAVMNPGVYHLSLNSRVQDALIAAGGLSSKAQRAWVAKNINLALPLKDGTKIYIPFQGEVLGNQSIASDTSSSSININSSTKSELDSLPGIGEVSAQKIIDNRPYNTIEELLEKKVVSQSVFEKIKEKITTY